FLTNLLGLGAVAADEMPFPDAVIVGDPGASTQTQFLDMHLAAGLGATPSVVGGFDFSLAGSTVSFTPDFAGDTSDQLQIVPGINIKLTGTGVNTQPIYLDRAGLISALTNLVNKTGPFAGFTYTLAAAETTAFSAANVAATADAIIAQAT